MVKHIVLIIFHLLNHGLVVKKRNSFTISYYDTKYSNAYDPYTGRYSSVFADSSFIKTTGFGVSLGKQLKWPDDYFSLVYGINLQQYKLKNYNIFPGLNKWKFYQR